MSTEGIGPAAPADDSLGKEDRQGQNQAGNDVDQNEGRAAILTDQVRETPDVAEADCRPRHRHNDGEITAEGFSTLIHHILVLRSFAIEYQLLPTFTPLIFGGSNISKSLSINSLSPQLSRKLQIQTQTPSRDRYASQTY